MSLGRGIGLSHTWKEKVLFEKMELTEAATDLDDFQFKK